MNTNQNFTQAFASQNNCMKAHKKRLGKVELMDKHSNQHNQMT